MSQADLLAMNLFAHAPDALFVVTHEGLIWDANPAACRLAGLAHCCLVGQQVTDLLLSERLDTSASCYLPLLASGAVEWSEGRCVTADGRTIPVELRASHSTYVGVPLLLLHVRDISQRRQLEAQLRQAQQMEHLGWLASGVAHDFNNLATAISGYAKLALDQLSPDDALYSDLSEIRAMVECASRLTRHLLSCARQQILQPLTFNLNDLILNMERLLQRLVGSTSELVVALSPESVWITADPGQIEQLLINLVINARDALPQGGRVLIETHNSGPNRPQPLALAANGSVCLTVADTGVGMDEAVKRHLFEAFYTTKAPGQGMGLGLATCYSIVKRHGGQITVQSDLGKGSTFTIYLPQATEAAEQRPEAEAQQPPADDSQTLLLIADETANETFVLPQRHKAQQASEVLSFVPLC